MECNGEQQELEAGWPVRLQLESVEEVREGTGSVGGLGVMSRGLKYPRGARWACWERAGAQPGVLARYVPAKPFPFPANREFGDQTQLKYGLIPSFWVVAPGSRGKASHQPRSNPPDRRPAGTKETKLPSTGVVRQPDRDVSVLVLSLCATSPGLPTEDGLSTLLCCMYPSHGWSRWTCAPVFADDCLPCKIRGLALEDLIPQDNLSWKCQQGGFPGTATV